MLPVISSLLLTIVVVVMGLGLILVRGWELLANPDFHDKTAKVLSVSVIQAIDLFLVGSLHGEFNMSVTHRVVMLFIAHISIGAVPVRVALQPIRWG